MQLRTLAELMPELAAKQERLGRALNGPMYALGYPGAVYEKSMTMSVQAVEEFEPRLRVIREMAQARSELPGGQQWNFLYKPVVEFVVGWYRDDPYRLARCATTVATEDAKEFACILDAVKECGRREVAPDIEGYLREHRAYGDWVTWVF